MTARRGSFRFKVTRLASKRLGRDASPTPLRKRVTRWLRFSALLAVGAIILFTVGAFALQTGRVAAENYRLHKQIVSTERRNDALVADSARLRREITLLHDPDYLVPLIHEQLGLVKPHEVFIVISPTPAPGR
jgi:cell division protein FtsB